MLVRQVITSLNRRSTVSGGLQIASFNTTSSIANIESTEGSERPKRKLKEWRKLPELERSFLGSFQLPKGDKPKPRKVPLSRFSLAPHDLMQWIKTKAINYHKYDQRFVTERHQALGCDLAAAHFLVFRGGKVKFHGQEDWKVRNADQTYDLPTSYDPTWQLTHLDAGGVDLYYEGLENFINLRKVEWASFKGNPYFDDWCMDKVAAHFPNVEYLDVSECPMLTERGIEALYKSYKLKKLIITDWEKKPSFELTCVMLEDCLPDLNVEIKDPPAKIEKKKQ